MVQPRHRFHFLEELPPGIGADEQLRPDHLEGDEPLVLGVARLENHALPALAQAVQDVVRAKDEILGVPG